MIRALEIEQQIKKTDTITTEKSQIQVFICVRSIYV